MARIVAVSDIHADAVTLGEQRFDEIARLFHTVADFAISTACDVFIFGGDLCNPDNGVRTIRSIALALEVFKRLDDAEIGSVWLKGNHDVFEDSRGGSVLTPLAAAGATVVDKPSNLYFEDCELVISALPYTASHEEYDQAETIRSMGLQINKKRIFLNHANVEGIVPGSEENELARGRSRFLPYKAIDEMVSSVPGHRPVRILNGHIHDGQSFTPKESKSGTPIHIIGSLARFTFGEQSNDPNFMSFTL